ncbi:tyrosine-type recombinase/integrase [Delftia acidovorans]|mgnify:CR=1 FL=1|uniref:tyrosine-type recombinase/integrase n=1 Tax=Delftia acidovorans TaxID=80866 RepID=UPI00241DF64D|nr:integrase family protein [Delftia acidovorans]
MARPSKNQPVDLSTPINITPRVIERLVCPEGKDQAFLRDALIPGLRVRVSAHGAKSFVFERKVGQKTVRKTLGDVRVLTVDEARASARRAHGTLDAGESLNTPAALPEPTRDATVQEAWSAYLADRKSQWGERHYADHEKLARPGGKKATRGTRGRGETVPGILYPLMALPLTALTPATIEAWAAEQAKTGPTQGRLGARMISAFINWCEDQPAYAGLAPRGAAVVKTKRVRETLGKARTKSDALLREQLAPWFRAVLSMSNPAMSAYLQVLLLTGARPGEVRTIRWTDIDWAWAGLSIRDKVEGDRIIPLTPYVRSLIDSLPRRSEWVFTSADGSCLYSPNHAHDRACQVAGVPAVTLHGLRRSFKSLTEWLEMPAGVVAQIMGHKPSATAEKHYTVRPLDLLRMHHEKIEAWVLAQACVPFVAPKMGQRLQVV